MKNGRIWIQEGALGFINSFRVSWVRWVKKLTVQISQSLQFIFLRSLNKMVSLNSGKEILIFIVHKYTLMCSTLI